VSLTVLLSSTAHFAVCFFFLSLSSSPSFQKSANHPHTNADKAALNMMTRTSAQDYVNSSIFMTAVDTGWINVRMNSKTTRRNGGSAQLSPADSEGVAH